MLQSTQVVISTLSASLSSRLLVNPCPHSHLHTRSLTSLDCMLPFHCHLTFCRVTSAIYSTQITLRCSICYLCSSPSGPIPRTHTTDLLMLSHHFCSFLGVWIPFLQKISSFCPVEVRLYFGKNPAGT
ncbi:hypothetical protein HETIRDRAFT_313523 [Heterobasidion irregulare TC 32-1]|uniref:Uncharacterized protein n=1 Tax=Heterobasidion irregulare (strain TC 32-1) TaxID=747525 RepID=W4KEK0_HETIT|nr:uncharacterized protein HETIRDRAFT_313523 [Heterobasidion irregulare TC 32-1]ETW84169.1 hypothetical protein HETIRDRAFT_313523 [Heterobasidion irregulare TC 32-1]